MCCEQACSCIQTAPERGGSQSRPGISGLQLYHPLNWLDAQTSPGTPTPVGSSRSPLQRGDSPVSEEEASPGVSPSRSPPLGSVPHRGHGKRPRVGGAPGSTQPGARARPGTPASVDQACPHLHLLVGRVPVLFHRILPATAPFRANPPWSTVSSSLAVGQRFHLFIVN